MGRSISSVNNGIYLVYALSSKSSSLAVYFIPENISSASAAIGDAIPCLEADMCDFSFLESTPKMANTELSTTFHLNTADKEHHNHS